MPCTEIFIYARDWSWFQVYLDALTPVKYGTYCKWRLKMPDIGFLKFQLIEPGQLQEVDLRKVLHISKLMLTFSLRSLWVLLVFPHHFAVISLMK